MDDDVHAYYNVMSYRLVWVVGCLSHGNSPNVTCRDFKHVLLIIRPLHIPCMGKV